MMNVVTGIFVEQAMAKAHAEQDVYVAKNVVDLFSQSELTNEGGITWEIFQDKLESKELQELFKAVHVDTSDAKSLFTLIDMDDSGSVDPCELMDGWIRLKGSATALDLAMLMRETDRMNG